jgi:hypothetical protein
MVHTQVQPLLALALEGLEKAKRFFIYRLAAHIATLILATIGAYALSTSSEPDHHGHLETIEFSATVLAILTEFVALFFHHSALELHSLGRQAIRRAMLLDALAPDDAPSVYEELGHNFGQDVHKKAAALAEKDRQLPAKERRLLNYYWSDKPTDQARLRDHLFESAIFSWHLYSAAWKFSLLSVLGLLAGALVVLSFLTVGSANFAVRVLLTLVSFLPLCQELDHLLLYRVVSQQLARLLKRLEDLYSVPLSVGRVDPRLLAELGDYNAATTFAPPIRTFIYSLLAVRLRNEFEKKMQELGQAPRSLNVP